MVIRASSDNPAEKEAKSLSVGEKSGSSLGDVALEMFVSLVGAVDPPDDIIYWIFPRYHRERTHPSMYELSR